MALGFSGATVARAVAVFEADTSRLDKGVKQAEGKLKSGLARMNKVALGVLGGIAGGAIPAVRAASDLSESINKANQVFKDSSPIIQRWSQSTARSIGIARAEALEGASSIGAMLKVAGTAPREAATMSKTMVQLAADMASFNNQDPSEMLLRIRSGLAGEAEPLRRFGVLLSESRVKTFAYKEGIAKAGEELTEQQKVLARYGLILQDTQDQQGDFARTSDGLANRQRILKAQLTDAAAALGTALLPAAQKVVAVLQMLTRWTQEHAGAAKVAIAAVAALAGAIVAINGVMKVARAVTMSYTAAVRLLSLAFRSTPIGLVITLLAALGLALATAWRRSQTFRRVVTGAWERIKAVGKRVFGAIGEMLSGLRRHLSGVISFFRAVVAGDWSAAWGMLRDAATRSLEAVMRVLGSSVNAIVTGFRRVGSSIVDVARRIRERISSTVSSIVRMFASIPSRLRGLGSALARVLGGAFRAGINAIIRAWNSLRIPSMSVKIPIPFAPDIKFSTPEINFPDLPLLQHGGLVSRLAGTPGRDSVLALLSPGEMVLTEEHQRRLGGQALLRRLLGLRVVRGPAAFAHGGVVAGKFHLPNYPVGASLADVAIAKLLYNAGFRGYGLTRGVAIVLAESGGDWSAIGDHGRSWGGWQFNLDGAGKGHSTINLRDPEYSTALAFRTSGGGSNYMPWSTHWNGRADQYMARARAAVSLIEKQLQGAKLVGKTGTTTGASRPSRQEREKLAFENRSARSVPKARYERLVAQGRAFRWGGLYWGPSIPGGRLENFEAWLRLHGIGLARFRSQHPELAGLIEKGRTIPQAKRQGAKGGAAPAPPDLGDLEVEPEPELDVGDVGGDFGGVGGFEPVEPTPPAGPTADEIEAQIQERLAREREAVLAARSRFFSELAPNIFTPGASGLELGSTAPLRAATVNQYFLRAPEDPFPLLRRARFAAQAALGA